MAKQHDVRVIVVNGKEMPYRYCQVWKTDVFNAYAILHDSNFKYVGYDAYAVDSQGEMTLMNGISEYYINECNTFTVLKRESANARNNTKSKPVQAVA